MFSDVDFSQPEVKEDVCRWGEWIGNELNLAGMRLDAIKHYSADFLKEFITHLDRTVGSNWFIVGEYWKDDFKVLNRYIERLNNRISLFDVTLVNNFSRISLLEEMGDLRDIFDGSLALNRPQNAVVSAMRH
jgi:alpha-amylase